MHTTELLARRDALAAEISSLADARHAAARTTADYTTTPAEKAALTEYAAVLTALNAR